jgi:hypothetical protein
MGDHVQLLLDVSFRSADGVLNHAVAFWHFGLGGIAGVQQPWSLSARHAVLCQPHLPLVVLRYQTQALLLLGPTVMHLPDDCDASVGRVWVAPITEGPEGRQQIGFGSSCCDSGVHQSEPSMAEC